MTPSTEPRKLHNKVATRKRRIRNLFTVACSYRAQRYTLFSVIVQLISKITLINAYQRVLAAAEPYFLRMFNGVDAVLLVDIVEQVGGVVLRRHLLLVEDVDADPCRRCKSYRDRGRPWWCRYRSHKRQMPKTMMTAIISARRLTPMAFSMSAEFNSRSFSPIYGFSNSSPK